MKFFILPFLIISSSANGQFKKIKTIEVSEEIISATIDRPGDLYLTTTTGQLLKYNKDGIIQVVYKNNPSPDLFEPRDGARMFGFYRSKRQYAYLTPSFEFLNLYVVDSTFVIDPWLVSSSGDFNLWAIDAADNHLKKINTRTGQVVIDEALEINASEFICMREYQGLLFSLTKSGNIIIFNSLGKVINKIENQEIRYFNFLGEEIYYQNKSKIFLIDLFTDEHREITLTSECNTALLTDERLYLIKGKTIEFFEVKP